MNTRKKTKPAEPASMEKIKSVSHDLLLAGIGAWVHSRKSKGEGKGSGKGKGKSEGMPDYATLVSEGRKAEPEFKASMQKTWDEWKAKTQSLGSGNRFSVSGDRLRGAFDERVSSAIGGLGLPTRKEMDALQAKVDRLLEARQPGRRKAAAKKAAPAAKKAAAKRAPARGSAK